VLANVARLKISNAGGTDPMQCPHCHASLLRKERYGRKCSACKRKFALEPKENAFLLHDVLFRRIIEQMSRTGEVLYTPEQLRYRAARKVTATYKRHNIVLRILGVLFWMLFNGFIYGFIMFLFLAIVIPTVVNILLGILNIETRITSWLNQDALMDNPYVTLTIIGVSLLVLLLAFIKAWGKVMGPYTLPMDTRKFEKQILKPWRKIYGPPAGLIDSETVKNSPEIPPDPAQVQAVLACPQRDVLDSLRVNQVPARLNIQLVPTTAPFTATQKTMLERLRHEPGLPLLLLHDASADGCVLQQTVIKSLGLHPDHHIVDIGLYPSQAIAQGMMQIGAPPSESAMELLKKRRASTKKLPAGEKLPYSPLSDNEFEWLKKGYYTPILSVPPGKVISAVSQAVQRLSQRSVPVSAFDESDATEQQAQQKAQAVGFMTWPA
jgi:hypothetical protein